MESSPGSEASTGNDGSSDRTQPLPGGSGASAERSRRGKLGRIAGHTRGLFEDLREWLDLRLDLAILELEERVDNLRNEIALGLTLAFFGFFAALFAFTTIALGLGWLLGHAFWGFLIVSVGLLLAVTALATTRPDLVPPSNLFEKIRERTETGDASDRPESEEEPGASDDDERTR